MVYPNDLPFNSAPSTVMYLDLNSCFAGIEQQANPLYRGRPLAVAAYASPRGCILAASVEAKKLGIKVGLRVEEGRRLCPSLIVVEPDTDKYRYVHAQFHRLLSRYTPALTPKSIDEFILIFDRNQNLFTLGRDIKTQIRRFIGDWLTVSIGFGPSRFLAKIASNLKKPDGLEEINAQNFLQIYSRLQLTDLHGINHRLASRLFAVGIYTPLDFYAATLPRLKSAFKSINSLYWYLRLRGREIDNIDFSRKSFGNMYSLPTPFSSPHDLAPILSKLVEKTTFRLRRHGFATRGLHLGILYKNHQFWHKGFTLRGQSIFAGSDIHRLAFKLLLTSPRFPVANFSFTCFNLVKNSVQQLDFFDSLIRKVNLTRAVDRLNQRYGNFVISPATMLGTTQYVRDRIGFGNIGDIDII